MSEPPADDATDTAPSRKITLTNAPPVRIRDEDWPVIATERWHDGKLEFQALRNGWMYVRKHADGRMIVYGGADSRWENERSPRAGEIVGAGASPAELVDAIVRVARQIGAREHVASDLIARLPAVEI